MKFAILLSGSGVYDGSEIHEATLSMYAICKNNCEYEIFAPDIDQADVINHITGQAMDEERNVLVESARIARGNIKALRDFYSENFDALIIPGGFGTAKNLSNYASKNRYLEINKEVEECIISMHKAKKAIGALCISPIIIAKLIKHTLLTIGNDKNTYEDIEALESNHKTTSKEEICIDKENNIYTCACYMLDSNIYEIGLSIEKLIEAIVNN